MGKHKYDRDRSYDDDDRDHHDGSGCVVCFAQGTLIATPSGARPVEDLAEGSLVTTMDNGPQAVVWIGHQRVAGQGSGAPVWIDAGALGNDRPMRLSQQHRIWLRDHHGRFGPRGDEVLVPAKALVGQAGVGLGACAQVDYYHLLLQRHEILFADGVPAESLLPGPVAMGTLDGASQRQIGRLFPEIAHGPTRWQPARALVRPGQWMRRHVQLQAGRAAIG